MSDTDKPVLCPVCQRELETSAWLPCEGGHYESFDHYQCYGCGTVEKDFVDSVIKRVNELEAQVLAEQQETLAAKGLEGVIAELESIISGQSAELGAANDLIYDAYELGQEDAETNAIKGYGSEPYKSKAQVMDALKESE